MYSVACNKKKVSNYWCWVTQSLTLWPHGLQHERFPCPSPSPGACSNSWPMESTTCPLSQWCHPTTLYSVVPFSFFLQTFPTSGSFLMSWLFASGGQSIGASASVSVLPMNIQGWFLLGLTGLISLCLLIPWLQSLSTVILEPKKIKSVTVSIVSPLICHEVMGLDAMILVFWTLSFKASFLLYSFTFSKKLFSSSSFSAIRVVSAAYLMLLIFLLAVLIPACASSSPAFCMMFTAYKVISRVTIYSNDVLLSQFWNCPLFHVQFWLLLLDLYTGFSGGG